MNFGSNNEKQAMKHYIISLLVKQAESDGHFSTIEKKYLNFASRALKLSDAEVATIRQKPEHFEISPPPDENMRMTILYYLLFMMKADQEVGLEEEVLCYQIGFRMGFREEMVASLIELMKEYLKEDLPPDSMLERIKPFLN